MLKGIIDHVCTSAIGGEGDAFYMISMAENLIRVAGALQGATLSEFDLLLCETGAKREYLAGLHGGRKFREPKREPKKD